MVLDLCGIEFNKELIGVQVYKKAQIIPLELVKEVHLDFDIEDPDFGSPIDEKDKVHFVNLNEFRETIEITATNKQREKYIKRFLPTALVENNKYNIPASIKLAQGILESNAGTGTLAKKARNHFGIKSFNGKGFKMCDDSCDDKFRIFGKDWDSWRYHSTMLTSLERYKPLFATSFPNAFFSKYKNLRGRNYYGKKYSYGIDPNFQKKLELLEEYWDIPYKRFAYGLDILGYATDNRYADSLIKLIEENNLNDLDKVEVIW